MNTLFIPFENFTLVTPLSKDEVRKRLLENTEPKKFFRMPFRSPDSHKLYEGEVRGYEFNIRRIIHYGNGYLPVVEGRIVPAAGKTMVHIVMRPSIYAIAFGAFVIISLIGLIIYYVTDLAQSVFIPGVIAASAMLVLFYTLATLGFKLESRRNRKFFTMELKGTVLRS